MEERITVHVTGSATVRIDTKVQMKRKDYEDLCAEMESDDIAGEAIRCILFDFADMRYGDFDDLEIETFEATQP